MVAVGVDAGAMVSVCRPSAGGVAWGVAISGRADAGRRATSTGEQANARSREIMVTDIFPDMMISVDGPTVGSAALPTFSTRSSINLSRLGGPIMISSNRANSDDWSR